MPSRACRSNATCDSKQITQIINCPRRTDQHPHRSPGSTRGQRLNGPPGPSRAVGLAGVLLDRCRPMMVLSTISEGRPVSRIAAVMASRRASMSSVYLPWRRQSTVWVCNPTGNDPPRSTGHALKRPSTCRPHRSEMTPTVRPLAAWPEPNPAEQSHSWAPETVMCAAPAPRPAEPDRSSNCCRCRHP